MTEQNRSGVTSFNYDFCFFFFHGTNFILKLCQNIVISLWYVAWNREVLDIFFRVKDPGLVRQKWRPARIHGIIFHKTPFLNFMSSFTIYVKRVMAPSEISYVMWKYEHLKPIFTPARTNIFE